MVWWDFETGMLCFFRSNFRTFFISTDWAQPFTKEHICKANWSSNLENGFQTEIAHFLSKRLYPRLSKWMCHYFRTLTHCHCEISIHVLQLHHCLYVHIYIRNKAWKVLRLSRTMMTNHLKYLAATSTQIMFCIKGSKVFIWIDFISLNVKVTNNTCIACNKD